jgi:hypothetical protein
MKKKPCTLAGRSAAQASVDHENIPAWARRHLADCPRCRRRARGAARLALALTAVKCQPHQADLLARGNTRTITMLKRAVRDTTKARKLRAARPQPALAQRLERYSQSLSHAAACLAVLGLMKWGVFQTMTRVEERGKQVVNQYYTHNLDKDIVDQIL